MKIAESSGMSLFYHQSSLLPLVHPRQLFEDKTCWHRLRLCKSGCLAEKENKKISVSNFISPLKLHFSASLIDFIGHYSSCST